MILQDPCKVCLFVVTCKDICEIRYSYQKELHNFKDIIGVILCGTLFGYWLLALLTYISSR